MTRWERVCYPLSALCLLLGALLLGVYTPMRFSGGLLCCASAALAALALLDRLGKRRRACRIGKRILLALLAAGTLFFAVLEAWVLSWDRTDTETPVSAMVIFGAGVNGTTPSLSLLSRLEAALDYIEARPGESFPIVVSGCQGEGEDVSEAECMADWLVSRGVPADRVLLEDRARNTRENVRCSMALLSERGVDVSGSIAFCSSGYHLCRAVYAGGCPCRVPVAGHLPERYRLLEANYYVREAFALAYEMVLHIWQAG